MKNVAIFRRISDDQGTRGRLVVDDLGFNCYTMELPWRDNNRSISCIPNGIYICNMAKSNRWNYVYTVNNVPNRTYIRIHWGNVAGDEKKGFKSHSEGCILLGDREGTLYGQEAILLSKLTVINFMNYMNRESFRLHVIGGF